MIKKIIDISNNFSLYKLSTFYKNMIKLNNGGEIEMNGNIINSNLVYYKLYVNKKHKELIKDNGLNVEILGIKSYDAPNFYLENDEGKYYIFEDEDYSSKEIGSFIEKIYKYCKDDFIFTIGYSKNNVKFKYAVKDKKIYLNNYSEDTLNKRYNELRNYIISAMNRFDEYFIYIEDDEFYDKIIPNADLDCDDFSCLADDLKEAKLSFFQLAYMEEIAELIKIVEPIIERKYRENRFEVMRKLPNIKTVYIENSNKKEVTHSKDTPKKSYWKDIVFRKEANLWGLSKEDRRIAKKERMSPADYIEAEEKDDDNLDNDD